MTEGQAIKIRSALKLTDELATEIDEAITKQVPMMVRGMRDFCVCQRTVYPHMKYCPGCGQELDWGSDTNDR